MIQAETPPLILASGSASRRALLEGAGLRFTVEVAPVDEAAIKEACRAEGIGIADTALTLADAKARRVAMRQPGAVVIGADQMLACGDQWFDKPGDMAAARAQLVALRGRAHELVGGVVCWRGGQRIWQNVAISRMEMRGFSDGFLDAYLDHEGTALLASVGAYRLEGPGVQLFSRVAGDQSAVLGLSLMPLLGFLRQHGVLGE